MGEIAFECVCWYYKRYFTWAKLADWCETVSFPLHFVWVCFATHFRLFTFMWNHLNTINTANGLSDRDLESVCMQPTVSMLCKRKKQLYVLNIFSIPLSRMAVATFMSDMFILQPFATSSFVQKPMWPLRYGDLSTYYVLYDLQKPQWPTFHT